MADPTVSAEVFDSTLSNTMFSEQQPVNTGDDHDDVDALDFDFYFDDLLIPATDFEDLLSDHAILENSNSCQAQPDQDPNLENFCHGSNIDPYIGVFKSTSEELRHVAGDDEIPGDYSLTGSDVLSPPSPALESQQISGYLDVPSPESGGSNPGSIENCDIDEEKLSYPSPETQGSGNFESHGSEDSNNYAAKSGTSLNSNGDPVKNGIVDQEIKLEEPGSYSSNNSLLKRKKEWDDLTNDLSAGSRLTRCRASECNSDKDDNSELTEEEEKRKTRLMRNRESAQLSRQRKKLYVEELEDKVKMMHSTIQDLNAKISYFMTENVTLRQQMGNGGVPVPPAQMPHPSPGMYPHPAMMYPWVPGASPYMVKPKGSYVPLVPIPRLKPQQAAQISRASKKVDNKKNDGPRTKKVAGVSFLGFLFFIMLFGWLAPVVNVRYGGFSEVLNGRESFVRDSFYKKHPGRVLMVDGTEYGEKFSVERDCSSNNSAHCGQIGHGSGVEPNVDQFSSVGNRSEPLVASLYVPRNDRLVKIDGNLIIHSVMASEKAMESGKAGKLVTELAVSGDLAPAIPVPGVGRNGIRHPQLRAIGSISSDQENLKSTATNGRLQQWFREGLTGPMLSSGMCSEVFQFDVSSASSGAIFPASTSRNISEAQIQNSTYIGKGGRNRRFLQDQSVPLPRTSRNTSGEHKQRNAESDSLNRNNITSSMVVSVLVDPREATDGNVDGAMGKNPVSRIFVVVLMDSVKYVTYSCMLPFMGSAPHLVTN